MAGAGLGKAGAGVTGLDNHLGPTTDKRVTGRRTLRDKHAARALNGA